MIFRETLLSGAYVIDLEPRGDERGFLARSWCPQEFSAQGIVFPTVQCNIVYNEHKGTLRGMHYQTEPHGEAKLVRCTQGAVYDVIIDLRPESPTYLQWFAAELSADNRTMLYIPVGFAHGMQTLTDGAELFYQMSEYYHPECATGVRWDDPVFGIVWPEDQRIISTRDREYPDFHP